MHRLPFSNITVSRSKLKEEGKRPSTSKMPKLSSPNCPPPLIPLMLILSCLISGSAVSDMYLQAQCLKVPVNDFVGSLREIGKIISEVTSTLSKLGGFLGESRLSLAVLDCLELLELSGEEISWTMAATHDPNGSKNSSTGDMSYDLRTWLSAAMVNQDTCIQGFEGTSGFIQSRVVGTLNQITSMVREALHQIEPGSSSESNGAQEEAEGRGGHSETDKKKFPFWFKREDRKLQLANGLAPDVVVAKDGPRNYGTIMEAVEAAPELNMRRFVIYVKRGVYEENVEIKKKKWNIMMVGDGIDATIITGNRSNGTGWTTFRSATFAVSGRNFIARDMTIENTAGPFKNQSVALRSDSDLSVYYRVELRGYQDTLYTHTMRQFYRECKITGTVDFIFGSATAVFQNCEIKARGGRPGQKNTITAHGRTDPHEPTGYSIQFCNISADIDSGDTYLGRPWKNFSRTVVMQSYLSDAIRPEGWLEWNMSNYLDTLYYGEYANFGPGAGVGKRVNWPGYHVLNNSDQASSFTVAQFIEGNLWLPSTGVKYNAGLSNE